ncbi:MAG TPA: FAD:protein FMN transferase [Elusimicrobia bacterium]|nr:FAD:protein FMN transferase [Elusimicrobiota bacterium]
MKMRKFLLTAAVLPLLAACSGGDGFTSSRPLMDTFVTVTAYGDRAAARAAADAAFDEMDRVVKVFNAHDPDSELGRLNASAGAAPFGVSPELFGLIELSLRYSELTGGAFDITVGPVLDLWREARRTGRIPGTKALAAARARTGWRGVILDPGERTIKFAVPGMKLDLGGAAKGFVVDKGVEELRRRGVKAALIDAGGDLRAYGRPPGRKFWKIGIKHPREKGALLGLLKLAEPAVATSGDYERYFEKDGKKYHHIIDPVSGGPAPRSVGVTAVAPTCAEADIIATALFVMGPEKGLALLETAGGLDAAVVTAEAGRIGVEFSAGLRESAELYEGVGEG